MASFRLRKFREPAGAARPSSQEDFHTGVSAFNPDEAIHSTMQFGGTDTQQLPLHYDQYVGSEAGSEGSADMSIELGRGVKRPVREDSQEFSSNAVFTFGDESQYELTGTPPFKSHVTSRKESGMLRREASVRQASETVKANEAARRTSRASGARLPSGSGGAKANVKHDDEHEWEAQGDAPATTTINARNTRFQRAKHMPAQHFSATQASAAMPVASTANSFMLPDMTDIQELVQGAQRDATPTTARNTTNKRSSRFTPSVSYRMPSRSNLLQDHLPVESIAIPEDEKRIFASLQILQDKVAQLELDKSEAYQQLDEYEGEIIDLQIQVEREQRLRRPDSALGSEDETDKEKWRMERTKLQASMKALQQRLERSERKVSINEIAVKRVTKERDEVVTRMGVVYYNMEEVKSETEELREDRVNILDHNEELKDQVATLTAELNDLKAKSTKQAVAPSITRKASSSTKASGIAIGKTRKRPQKSAVAEAIHVDDIVDEPADELSVGDLDQEARERIAKAVQQQLERMKADSQRILQTRSHRRSNSTRVRSRSKSQPRQEQRIQKGASSQPSHKHVDVSDDESCTDIEMTKAFNDTKDGKWLKQAQQVDATITELTSNPPLLSKSLRQALEEQRRAGHLRRQSSAPVTSNREPTVVEQLTAGLTRKSSLKDITAGLNIGVKNAGSVPDGNTIKVTKSVRVQSPHHSLEDNQEEGDVSIASNTSRRRRSSKTADEGETSAFIIPDITLHTSAPGQVVGSSKPTIAHSASKCTVCAAPNDQHVDAPLPLPVSERKDLPEDATLRPSQPPHLALAMVLKQLQDEVVHIKLVMAKYEQDYHAHEPSLGASKRKFLVEKIRQLRADCEKKSSQIYALYDVVEGQKTGATDVNEAELHGGKGEAADLDQQALEDTMTSVGISPAEMAGRIGRSAPPLGLDGVDDGFSDGESLEMPVWDGLSDEE